MFNKINTKYLIIAFLGLLAIALITVPTSNKKKSRSFKSELTGFDTSIVTKFTIYPKANGDLITFVKKDNNWLISDKEGEYNADNTQVKNMLETLSDLKAKRLAAKGKDSWSKYEVTDSLGTRIEVTRDKKIIADVYIGKFSYSQPSQPANPYQRTQGTMTSFVRISDEKEVYAIDGFLSMTFNRKKSDYRDSKLLQVQKSEIQQISFTQPNQNFTLSKNDSIWMVDGLIADSAGIANYLSNLSYVSSSEFIANENKPLGSPNYTLKLTGENGAELAAINAYYSDSTNIAIRSSMNPGTWFDGTGANLFTKLFKDKSEFLSQ